MKKVLLVLTCFFIISNGIAQDTLFQMRREFYLSIDNFSPLSLSLKYKKQIRQKTYFKIGLVSLSASANDFGPGQYTNAFPVKSQRYSGGLEIGIEFRKVLSKKLSFFHGPSLRGIYQYQSQRILDPSIPPSKQKNEMGIFNAVLPYSLGLLFQVTGNFYVSSEINPAIYYSTNQNVAGINQNGYNYNFGFELDNRSVIFSLVYRY